MVLRRLLVLLPAALLLTACGLELPSGQPPLELVTERVTWLPTDRSGSVEVEVHAVEDADDVLVEVDTTKLARVGDVRPGKDCERDEQMLLCELGDLEADETGRVALLRIEPYAGAPARHRIPVSVRTRTSERLEVPVTVGFVTGPHLVASQDAEGRVVLTNVGTEAAEGASLVAIGPAGSSYASTFANCRPVVEDERTAVCAFDGEIPRGRRVRTSVPLEFEGVGGGVSHRVGVGASDPEGLGTLGFVDGEAPELSLEPVD